MLFGHLAVSFLQHRYLGAELVPVMAAGVFPDVADKSLRYVLDVTPSGRMFGHTPAMMALSTGGVGVIWGQRAAQSWALGYVGHLIGDFAGFVPWLHPFVQYQFQEHRVGLWEAVRRWLANPVAVGAELGLSLWAVWTLSHDWRHARRRQSGVKP